MLDTELLWLHEVLRDCGRPISGPFIVKTSGSFIDKTSASTFNDEYRYDHAKAKPIDVIQHWCLNRVGRKEVAFKYCRTEPHRADCLTKALS